MQTYYYIFPVLIKTSGRAFINVNLHLMSYDLKKIAIICYYNLYFIKGNNYLLTYTHTHTHTNRALQLLYTYLFEIIIKKDITKQ